MCSAARILSNGEERAPWLPAVRELLRSAVARDLPTLGICLGMELPPVACGGEVRHAARPEVGCAN
ncbi:glutamine amidotransferase-related protein [Streptomyces sp. NBC_00829]|uniref:glutamine amidotransferase-related protein n=1 Tax=Streptomyces sp. NBC_00829 TaxID=2903679 RepID=UPI0038684366|nr:gamma-glutamyl-gamma-aminobutyrate hydrolase family protein [Streptomyces sp. NBC_00829]